MDQLGYAPQTPQLQCSVVAASLRGKAPEIIAGFGQLCSEICNAYRETHHNTCTPYSDIQLNNTLFTRSVLVQFLTRCPPHPL